MNILFQIDTDRNETCIVQYNTKYPHMGNELNRVRYLCWRHASTLGRDRFRKKIALALSFFAIQYPHPVAFVGTAGKARAQRSDRYSRTRYASPCPPASGYPLRCRARRNSALDPLRICIRVALYEALPGSAASHSFMSPNASTSLEGPQPTIVEDDGGGNFRDNLEREVRHSRRKTVDITGIWSGHGHRQARADIEHR